MYVRVAQVGADAVAAVFFAHAVQAVCHQIKGFVPFHFLPAVIRAAHWLAQPLGVIVQVLQGDLTRETTDAIVTAANRTLSGGNQAGFGGGVDGAIHRAAGPELLAACSALGGCDHGDAVATAPAKLAAKIVVHAVGPIWGTHEGREDELLVSAHRRSLEVATEHGCRSISFPAISCGVYKFPVERAAKLALGTIVAYLAEATGPVQLVRYLLYSEADYGVFVGALWELAESEERLQLEI